MVWGAIIAGGVSLAQSAINKGGSGPKTPFATDVWALTLVNKWYRIGIGRNPDSDGAAHWVKEIKADGPEQAFGNFSTSPEPKKANAIANLAAVTSTLGNAYELAPGFNARSRDVTAEVEAAIRSYSPETADAFRSGTVVPVTLTPTGTAAAPAQYPTGSAATAGVPAGAAGAAVTPSGPALSWAKSPAVWIVAGLVVAVFLWKSKRGA